MSETWSDNSGHFGVLKILTASEVWGHVSMSVHNPPDSADCIHTPDVTQKIPKIAGQNLSIAMILNHFARCL